MENKSGQMYITVIYLYIVLQKENTDVIWCGHMVVNMSHVKPVQPKISHLKKQHT